MKANIFFNVMGTAGAGKSTMVSSFQIWMQRQGYDAVTVNLDPGGVNTPYAPDVDIRDWVKLEDIMDEYSLGPNGAQVAASDMMYQHMDDIRESLEGFRADYFLVDTPGQMELYAYREPTRDLIRSLSFGRSAALFLYDPLLAGTPEGMVSQLTLAASIRYRLEIPFYQALNKVDLLDDATRDRVLGWLDPERLYEALISPGGGRIDHDPHMCFPEIDKNASDLLRITPPPRGSMEVELGINLFRALEAGGDFARLVPCSATTMEGIEDIYSLVQTGFMGGEDLEPS